MKFPIAWHKDNLRNFEQSLQQAERELLHFQARVERMRSELAFRKRQIEEAERRGLDRFDPDRILVKRK